MTIHSPDAITASHSLVHSLSTCVAALRDFVYDSSNAFTNRLPGLLVCALFSSFCCCHRVHCASIEKKMVGFTQSYAVSPSCGKLKYELTVRVLPCCCCYFNMRLAPSYILSYFCYSLSPFSKFSQTNGSIKWKIHFTSI